MLSLHFLWHTVHSYERTGIHMLLFLAFRRDGNIAEYNNNSGYVVFEREYLKISNLLQGGKLNACST